MKFVSEMARQLVCETPIVGLSIGIINNDEIYTVHCGEIERGTHKPPTNASLYALASVTKTFTATLLAQAVVEKKVSLHADIREYLNGEYPNLGFEGHPIQLHHLINHNSGLPFNLPNLPGIRTDYNNESEIDRLIKESRIQSSYNREDFYHDLRAVKIEHIPGSRLQYSNSAVQLLGYILEGVYGVPYEQLIQTKIANPLDMTDTKVVLEPAEQMCFKGYNDQGQALPDNSDYLQAAGGLKSTVNDMLKYIKWHLLENDESVKLTHQPTWNLGGAYSIGLNWQMFLLPGYRFIWQEGSLPGHSSYCVVCPELHLGIIALMNEFDPDSSSCLTTMVKQIIKTIDPRAISLP